MTLSETETFDFDKFEAVIAEVFSGDTFVDDREPSLAATPFFIEFDEPARLDPARAGLIWDLIPQNGWDFRWKSPLVSLTLHLLPIVAIVLFPLIAIEPVVQIPVQLVFEQPPQPPPPPPTPKPAQKPPQFETPPRGPLSSIDQGQVKPVDLGRTPDPVQMPAAGEPQPQPAPPTEAQTAAVPPPLPMEKPTPPKENAPAVQPPKPSGHKGEGPHEGAHISRYAGPAASRDEYLAYLVSLTRQHMDLLPLSVIGSRRGETVITVVVYDNGRIGPIGVLRSSGFPDIDERIQQMVRSVGKFPPLPQWYQGNAVQLELTLRFPEAVEDGH